MSDITRTITLTITGSPDLYCVVRAGFVSKGLSLNKWCNANGVNRQTAEKSLKGETNSHNARELILRLVEASGVELKG